MAQVIDRKEVHDLIDQLPSERIPAAVVLLKSMLPTVPDDEPVTDEDIQRYREGKAALNQPQKWVPMEEVLADFGLTPDDARLPK